MKKYLREIAEPLEVAGFVLGLCLLVGLGIVLVFGPFALLLVWLFS